MSTQNNQFTHRDEPLEDSGSTMGNSSPPDTDTDTDNDAAEKPNANQVLGSIVALLGGASNLTDSVGNAVNGGSSSSSNNNSNNSGNNNTTNSTVSPWIIGGGITVFLLLVGLIIMNSQNGNSSQNTSNA